MPRKAKKKVHPMPKLGWKDLLLYWSLMIFGYGGSIVGLFFPLFYRRELSARNPNMIAHTDGFGLLFSFWLVIWFAVFALIVTVELFRKRRPIFGRSDIKYGPPAYPRIYPLLMKNKPKFWESPKKIAQKKRLKNILVTTLVVTFLFSAAAYPLSLYGRFELLHDGSVVYYNVLNQQEHYRLRDMESVCLDTEATSSKSRSWYPRFEFTFADGKTCSFPIGQLGDKWFDAFRMAESLKTRYGDLVTITDTEDLWLVVVSKGLTPAEEEMLYRLFETEKD